MRGGLLTDRFVRLDTLEWVLVCTIKAQQYAFGTGIFSKYRQSVLYLPRSDDDAE
jgi:hypothetical protein